jgi:TusA-related sulfurtransferase
VTDVTDVTDVSDPDTQNGSAYGGHPNGGLNGGPNGGSAPGTPANSGNMPDAPTDDRLMGGVRAGGGSADADDVPDTPPPSSGGRDVPPPGLTVDARGRRCPIPVIELARRIGEVERGGTVELLADDPAAALDVAAWCRMRRQALLGTHDLPGGATAYLVCRLA